MNNYKLNFILNKHNFECKKYSFLFLNINIKKNSLIYNNKNLFKNHY